MDNIDARVAGTQSMLPRLGYATTLIAAAAIATLIGAVTGTIIVFVLLNFFVAIAILVRPVIAWEAVVLGAICAAPVTLGLLPLSALILRKRRLALRLVLPVTGLVGGGITMWIWLVLASVERWQGAFEAMIVAGALAGLAAGVFYGHVMAEERA